MADVKIKGMINTIKDNRAALKDTTMQDILEASTPYKVISYSDTHKDTIREIAAIGSEIKAAFSSSPITRQIFQSYRINKVNAFRNNEVGDLCEILMQKTFEKNRSTFKLILDVRHSGGSGYPDLKIFTKSVPVFLEIKATSRPDKGSPRDFYYSPGASSDKKIDCSALHILLGFVTEQVQGGFLIKGFKLVDVSKIKVSLKPEFNTDNRGIYNSETIIEL